MFRRANQQQERGIALLIVVSVLTVIGIMGVAFAFSMYLETESTRQFVSAQQARYLAEAGIAYARALLDEDRLGSRVDDEAEPWRQAVQGRDMDADGDGTREARAWPVTDAAQQTVGRYALQIADEAGKANLNGPLADPAEPGGDGVDLTSLLERANIADPSAAAQQIIAYRYGPDQKPGKAGSDDDGDGAIDEMDEYQPLALRGDDRRIESLEELAAVAHLDASAIRRLARLVTAYSYDVNVSVAGKARVNLNTATPEELLVVLLDAGVAHPWQAAVNMADYVDADYTLSSVTKSAVSLSPETGMVEPGSWAQMAGPPLHYRSETPDGEPLTWTIAAAPTGAYRLLAHGVGGLKVGDIAVAGQLRTSVNDGESLGTFELGGPLTVTVTNREVAGTPCAFQSIELVVDAPESGVAVRGIEAVRINELMVDPIVTLDVTTAEDAPEASSHWTRLPGAADYQNGGVGQGTWTWTTTAPKESSYYVWVYGRSGETVGKVTVNGVTSPALLRHGEHLPAPVRIGSDGKVRLTIGKTDEEQTYYIQQVELSLQPDAEYVELINLSDREVSLGGWTLEGELWTSQGELAARRVAQLPAGARIAPHGLLAAAVDLHDADERLGGLAGNGVEARAAWDLTDEMNAVQLEFPSGTPTPEDDWLQTASSATLRVVLRDGAGVVDAVEYVAPPSLAPLQSVEKGDPTVVQDANQNGVDDGWYPSLKLNTPAQPNDNDGLKEQGDLETLVHDPSKEATVLNRPLTSVGELAGVLSGGMWRPGLASGEAWKPFASEDLAKLVDRLTVEGLRLEGEGHLIAGAEAWSEKTDGYYEYNHTQPPAVVGTWQWLGIPEGAYRLSVEACGICRGEQMSVRWQQADGSFTTWSAPLSTDARGRVFVGQVTIGMGQTAPNTLTLEVTCASPSGICHVDAVQLDPHLIRVGPINVNTAPLDVLLALPGMTEAMAQRLSAGRPYGDQDQKGRGIGDVLLGDALGTEEEDKLEAFGRLAHLLTSRSDVFQILSLGQAMDGEHVTASQRIQTIVQR